jgi:hypothetical protein
MTTERLDEIRKRCEAATKGPWESYLPNEIADLRKIMGEQRVPTSTNIVLEWIPSTPAEAEDCFGIVTLVGACMENDHAMLSHARADIPWLLSQLAQAERERDEARKVIGKMAEVRSETLRNAAGYFPEWAEEDLWAAIYAIDAACTPLPANPSAGDQRETEC